MAEEHASRMLSTNGVQRTKKNTRKEMSGSWICSPEFMLHNPAKHSQKFINPLYTSQTSQVDSED